MKPRLSSLSLSILGFSTVLVGSFASAAPPAAAPAQPAAGASLSAYPAEPKNPSSGKDIQTCGYYEKGIGQEYLGAGRYGESDMNQGVGATVSVPDCKFPAPSKGKWAKLQAWAKAVLKDDLRPGDVVMIPSKESWDTYESSDGSSGRSVHARWYSKQHFFTMTDCGVADPKIACEVSGSKTARGINILHFRIDEAARAKAANNLPLCQAAAKQAVAISRGIPKLRKALQASNDWEKGLTYKTRYDGVLKEDAAFAKIRSMGNDALKLFAACGGTPAQPTTTDAEENAFKP